MAERERLAGDQLIPGKHRRAYVLVVLLGDVHVEVAGLSVDHEARVAIAKDVMDYTLDGGKRAPSKASAQISQTEEGARVLVVLVGDLHVHDARLGIDHKARVRPPVQCVSLSGCLGMRSYTLGVGVGVRDDHVHVTSLSVDHQA